MRHELNLRFERRGEPPIEISSAWLIDESNAQQVASFMRVDNYTAWLDMGAIPSGRYWLSASIAKHPVLRFTIDIKGDAEKTVSFAGRPPRCAEIVVEVAREAKTERRVHTINIGMAPEHSAVVLVGGFDYHTQQGDPTDYSVFARQWRNDLYYGVTDTGIEPNLKIDRAIFDHTVVSVFNFATGDVQEQIRGVKGWHNMWEFMCGTQRPHTANPHSEQELRKTTDSISITDVYAYINAIGRHAPGTLTQLHFFSHGYSKGPVLLNTDDDSKSSARDSGDKDPRYKDFFKTNIKENWPHLPQAFSTGARVKSWGCFTDEYVRKRINAIKHTKSRTEEVEYEGAMISRDSVMMVVDDALYGSYVMAFVDMFGVDAWGPAPGTSAKYKTDSHHMYVDQSEYGSVLRWYEKYFGGRRDLSGHYPYAKLKLKQDP